MTMTSAASEARTALRAVSMIATPLESSQVPATSTTTPDPSCSSGNAAGSPEIVRNDAYARGVTIAAVNVPSQSRQPGSSPYVASRAATKRMPAAARPAAVVRATSWAGATPAEMKPATAAMATNATAMRRSRVTPLAARVARAMSPR